jgi:hypothetical protein
MTHITSITLTLGGLSAVLRILVTVFSSNPARDAIRSGMFCILAMGLPDCTRFEEMSQLSWERVD